MSSAEVTSKVSAKLLFLENVQVLLNSAPSRYSQGKCCRSICGPTRSGAQGVHAHRLVTGKHKRNDDHGKSWTDTPVLQDGGKHEGNLCQSGNENDTENATDNQPSFRLRIIEWLECNIKIQDIPPDAMLCLNCRSGQSTRAWLVVFTTFQLCKAICKRYLQASHVPRTNAN